jgi:type II secretory pathway predicted ATPase ExeA
MQKSSDNHYSPQAIENMGMDFISIECLEKLGLDQNPFIDHARDPFLFIDKQLEMSMNVLIDYLSNQNSTIVLLGEVGIGKTTHLRLLLRKGYQQFNFCTLRAKPKISFADIEKKIKERWRLPQDIDEDVSLLDIDSREYLTTDEHIKKYIEDDKHPVLIIDDAHRLQNSVIDELLKLKHHVGLQSPIALGLVLASEPSLQTQLAELEQTNPAATQIYQVNVRSFDTKQCQEYIRYRIDKASTANKDLFSNEKITEIYTKSKGIPKLINKLAREEVSKLCEETQANKNTTSKFQSSPSLRLGLILAGLVALAIVFTAVFNKPNQPEENIPLDLNKPKLEQSKIKPKDQVPAVKSDTDATHKNTKTDSKQTEPVSKPETKSISKPYVAPLVLGPLQDLKTDTKKDIVKKENVTAIEKPSNTSINDQGKLLTSDWILKQDPNAYTIQIVASPSEQNLLAFTKKNSLFKNTAYYKKTSADKSWFVLIHGIYASRDAAQQGIEGLSDALKKNTPYPIQIKYLQEIIRQQ